MNKQVKGKRATLASEAPFTGNRSQGLSHSFYGTGTLGSFCNDNKVRLAYRGKESALQAVSISWSIRD